MRSLRGPVRPRPRPGARAALAVLLPLLLVGGCSSWRRAGGRATTSAPRTPGSPPAPAPTPSSLDTTLYLPASATAAHPAPAVVLAHGFGGSKDSVADDARDLAGRGYVVLTYSARGFGRSTGQIGLDDPRYEVADLSTLIDLLATRRDVAARPAGDPRVGVAGASYGGALALLGAAYDRRSTRSRRRSPGTR